MHSKDALHRLGQEMSDISELCYCAGWLQGTEYFVPELCRRAIATGKPQVWGHGEVTPERARRVWDLATEAESWADLDMTAEGYVAFQPFPIPEEVLSELDRLAALER